MQRLSAGSIEGRAKLVVTEGARLFLAHHHSREYCKKGNLDHEACRWSISAYLNCVLPKGVATAAPCLLRPLARGGFATRGMVVDEVRSSATLQAIQRQCITRRPERLSHEHNGRVSRDD